MSRPGWSPPDGCWHLPGGRGRNGSRCTGSEGSQQGGSALRTLSRRELGRSRTVLAYAALTKPRIIELLLITTVPAMVVAKGGIPSLGAIAVTVLGGTLAAGGANAANMWYDRDIDSLMGRTRARPMVTGEISPRDAIIFALALEVVAFILLAIGDNLLSAALALFAALFYVFIYTIWLKRRISQNIVIGGVAGAVPVLVGWAAVQDSLSLSAWLMFAIIFVWTPPHFWGLAFRYSSEYGAAGVPMLPSVATPKRTATEILAYTVLLAVVTELLGAVAHLGVVYGVACLLLNAGFIGCACTLFRRETPKAAMRLFSFSITYLSLLFIGIAVDVVLRSR